MLLIKWVSGCGVDHGAFHAHKQYEALQPDSLGSLDSYWWSKVSSITEGFHTLYRLVHCAESFSIFLFGLAVSVVTLWFFWLNEEAAQSALHCTVVVSVLRIENYYFLVGIITWMWGCHSRGIILNLQTNHYTNSGKSGNIIQNNLQ